MRSSKYLMLLCLFFLGVNAFAQPRAYATNEGAGTISVIDIATDTVVSTIETGGKPRGLAVCKGSKKLYVTEQTKAQLWVIDPVKGVIEQRVALGESPEAVYCSPNGEWLGVANEGSNSISFIHTQRLKVEFDISVHGKNQNMVCSVRMASSCWFPRKKPIKSMC
jgi:YVTN family beta-propeller protein